MTEAEALEINRALDEIKNSFNVNVAQINDTAKKRTLASYLEMVRVSNASAESIGMNLLLVKTAVRRAVVIPEVTVNVAPVVTMTSPLEGQSYVGLPTITVSATVTDGNDNLTVVEIYRGATLLVSLGPLGPFTYIDPSVAVGTHIYKVKAYDGGGLTTERTATVSITAATTGSVNVAAAAMGAIATASSSYVNAPEGTFPPASANNGDRRGINWNASGFWHDLTGSVFPDWLEITLPIAQSINEIDVFTLQDNHTAPIDPTLATVFTLHGIRDFQVQTWNGSIWVDVTGGNVTGNDKVWRQFTFAPVTTDRIRVLVNFGLNFHSRIVEVEAWSNGTPAPIPPVVTLLTPLHGSTVIPGVTVPLSAQVIGANIESVKFYRGATLLNTSVPPDTDYTFNDTNVVEGTSIYKVVARNTNAQESEDTATVNVTVPIAGSGNWDSRKVAAGVVRYWDLASAGPTDAHLAGRDTTDAVGIIRGDQSDPFIDTSVAPPGGTASLGFVIPAFSSASSAGVWFGNFSGNKMTPGHPDIDLPDTWFLEAGSEFYLQWLYHVNTAWVTEDVRQPSGDTIGHKFLDITSGDVSYYQRITSSDTSKMVMSGSQWASWPLIYYRNAANSDWPIHLPKQNGDIDWQPHGDLVNYVSWFDVRDKGHLYIPPNSVGFPYPNEWNAYLWHVQILTNTPAGMDGPVNALYRCSVRNRLYACRTGGGSMQLAIDWTTDQWITANGYGKINIFPYLTNKDQSQNHATMRVNAARVIVSTQRPADPLEITVKWNPTWLANIKANPANRNVLVDIPGTTPSSYNLRPAWSTGNQPPCWEPRTIHDYCGMASDELRGEIFLAAHGGHASTSQNGVYGCLFTTDGPVWRTVRAATPHIGGPTPAELNTAYFPYDNRPVARHTYNNNVVVETSSGRKLVMLTAQGGGYQNTATHVTDGFNPDAADPDWDPPGSWTSPYASDNIGEGTAKDPRNQLVYRILGSVGIDRFDPQARTWTRLVNSPNGTLLPHRVGMMVDVTRNRLVIAGHYEPDLAPRFAIWNLTTSTYSFVTVTGPGVASMKFGPVDAPDSALTHDTLNDKYLWMASTAVIIEIDPNTWVCTPLCAAPRPRAWTGGAGLYNRLVFIPSMGGAVLGPIDWDIPMKFLWR